VSLILSAQFATAQGKTTASLRGVVTDPDGIPTPGVTVIARSEAVIGGERAAITNEQGVYRFPSLPPGMYQLEGVLPGFQNVLQDNVQLKLGANFEVNLQLANLEIADEIVVIAESSQVNTVSNGADFNLGENFVERQPIARDPTDLMNYAPGIQSDLAYGSPSSSQNAYNVDGVDVSDPELGTQWVLPSMDWVQEVQVGGLGADAEYGGFTGAVVNLITKSGGNEFHGDLRAYYSGGDLNSDNAPEGTEGTSKVTSDTDVTASFGGSVIQDKLWYFVSGNRRQRVVEPFFSQGAPVDDRDDSDRTETRVLGKLTWQVNQSNNAMFMVDWDDAVHDYRGVGDQVLASAAQRQESPNYVFAASWESLIGASSFLSAKLTGYVGGDDRLPYNGDIPNRYDRESRFDWQNLTSTSNKDVERTNIDLAYSLFVDGLLASRDSHNFKFGVVFEQSKSDYVTRRNGGFSYYDDSWYCDSLDQYFDDPICGVFSSDWGGEWNLRAEMDGLHAYVQDAWKIGRFTVNAGVRYSQYQGGFANASGTPYDVNMWAPRLGFVWDLMGDGKLAVKAHYGQYYDGLAVTLFDREASGEALSNTEYFDYNFDTGEFDIPAGGRVEAFATMDPDIEHPRVDQFLASVEYQLAPKLLVGVDYVNREFNNVNAQITANLDDYLALVAPDNPLAGGGLPFFELLSPQDNLITNPDEATRKYQSLAVRVERRYSNGWSLDGSLVWSDLTGTADWGVPGYGTGFDDLNGFTNADGKLPNNSQFVLKVAGSVDLPWGFLVSGFYQYRTGEFWTPYAQFEGLFYNDRTDIYLTERGSEQYEDRQVLDLRLEKSFSLGRSMAISIFADVFNVLDSDTVTAIDEQWGFYVYDWRDHPDGSFWDPSSTYLDPLSIQTPRQIRLGAKFSW
jgi:hypothetical protein